MAGLDLVLAQQPIPLESIPHILEMFPKLLAMKILQGLLSSTTFCTNPRSFRLGKPAETFDARLRAETVVEVARS